jgi:Transcriptional regulators
MAIGVLSALWQAGAGARGRRGGELRRHPVRRVPDAAAEHRADPAGGDGRQAVELLLRSIAGEPVPERTPLLPVELIVRDSCGGRKIPTTKERH